MPTVREIMSADLVHVEPSDRVTTAAAIMAADRARPGRCSVHPATPAIATCDVCDRPMCLACALPVRGRVVGPECLSVVVEAPPDVIARTPPRPKADWLIVGGFGLVVAVSIMPWS